MKAVSDIHTDAILGASVRVPQHIVHRSFPSETVVLNLQTGKYHGLNPVGGRMLEILERTASVREAAEVLTEEFDASEDELRGDLCRFCKSLAERGLIELGPGA